MPVYSAIEKENGPLFNTGSGPFLALHSLPSPGSSCKIVEHRVTLPVLACVRANSESALNPLRVDSEWQHFGSEHVLTSHEEAEFTALVERQSKFVFRVVYAVLLNPHDAEDAVQETFLKLYRNGGWRNADNERAYLARVAWRTAVDRRRSVHPETASLGETDPLEEAPSHQPGPEQTLLTTDHHALVHSLIDALPEELRMPLVLGAFEELSSREIAAILNTPEGTVRTRQQRARQILRKKLESLNISKQETRYA